MLKRVLRRCVREPLTSLAAMLFVAILSLIICFLHTSQEEELQDLTNTYYNTPITFEVCWLDGSRLYDLAPASGHFADLMPGLFLGNGRYQSEMKDMVKDLELRMALVWGSEPWELNEQYYSENGFYRITSWDMVGITSLGAAKNGPSGFEEIIEWEEGYDESILLTDQFVCIVPSYYEGPEDAVTLNFDRRNGKVLTRTFQIVGRYIEDNNYNMYCPYATMEEIYLWLSWPQELEKVSGKLSNNDNLEQFKEAAAKWFATPNPKGEPTPWENPFGYESYPLAMDIDVSQLEGIMKEMENSMTINRIASVLVFILSTGAGFLTGFLVIRSRKREIALMRTLGTSNGAVCIELILEQFFCVVAGIVIGGSYALWEPMGKLSIFAGVYMAGLTVALLIFANANLLATIKEDE